MIKRIGKKVSFIKIGILFAVIPMLLWNCNMEDLNNTELNSEEQKLKITTVTFKEVLNDPVFSSKIEELKPFLDSNKSLVSKKNNTPIIKTTNITKTQNGSITYYSFYILDKNLDNNKLENLIIGKKGNEVKSYVFKLDKKTNAIISVEKDSKYFNQLFTNVQSKGSGCGKIVPQCYLTGGGYTGPHVPNSSKCHIGGYIIQLSSCGGGIPQSGLFWGNNNNIDLGGNNGAGNSGGGSSNNKGGGQIGVSDKHSKMTSTIKAILPNCLDNKQLNFLDTNPFVALKISGDINSFLTTNGKSSKNMNFACNAVKAIFKGGEVDYDEQIINLLKDKAKCVYNKLKNNSLIEKVLSDFKGKDAPVHLIINEKDIKEEGVSGETEYGDNITITLDTPDMKNTPSLWVAQTILHESIHAKIYRMIRTRGKLGYNPHTKTFYLPNGSKANFPTLFNYYDKYTDNPQHNYMADYYRKAMEKGLKEYAKLIGETYPEQLYKDLAWAGLHNTNAWDKMYKDPIYTKNEQKRIINVMLNFKKSKKNDCM